MTVIDFVGNHRIFLERLHALLSLGETSTSATELRQFLEGTELKTLSAGCSVDVELEAKELLSRLFRVSGVNEVERAYRELALERGVQEDPELRPTAGELQRMEYLPSRLRDRHGSWFEFVRGEGHLSEDGLSVLDAALGFLREIETSAMTKSFKMVTLEALCEDDRLVTGMSVEDLALRCHVILRRSPELLADVADGSLRDAELGDADVARWTSYWRGNPIDAWTGERRDERTWFRVDEDDRFTLDLSIAPELIPTLTRMTRELVDYRLAQYLARKRRSDASVEGFACKVTWNRRDPIIKLPRRTTVTVPSGDTDVRLPDGSIWQFRFAKEYCNVARPPGVERNQLPDLLRQWFGPRAGQPGTAFLIRFYAGPDGLWVEPMRAKVVDFGPRGRVPAYPDLSAAAGHVGQASRAPDKEAVWLPLDNASPELFAVRVAGTSMDGGQAPLRDGDWAVMRLSRGQPASALENRVVLVEVNSGDPAARYQIKRLRRANGNWLLTSDNADGPTIEAASGMVVIARLERGISPSDLAPRVGAVLTEPELAWAFGLDELEPRSGRHQGHSFIFVSERGQLPEPDRVRLPSSVALHPSETAFVLASTADSATYRFLGVARHTADAGQLEIPAVDYATWRAYGVGRNVSRRLSEEAHSRAQTIVDTILKRPAANRWLQRPDGNRAHVLGPAPRGGLRIDGGLGGFAERTVSLIDLAWVLVAADDVSAHGGIVDEARVNRFRYLEGVPRSATRWIDTGWAIAAWRAATEDV